MATKSKKTKKEECCRSEFCCSCCNSSEIADFLRYVADYFDDGKGNGKEGKR